MVCHVDTTASREQCIPARNGALDRRIDTGWPLFSLKRLLFTDHASRFCGPHRLSKEHSPSPYTLIGAKISHSKDLTANENIGIGQVYAYVVQFSIAATIKD